MSTRSLTPLIVVEAKPSGSKLVKTPPCQCSPALRKHLIWLEALPPQTSEALAAALARLGRILKRVLTLGRDMQPISPSPDFAPTASSRKLWRVRVQRLRWCKTISFARHQFPPAIIRHAVLALCPINTQLSRCRRSARGARSGRLIRDGAAIALEVRTVVRPRTSPQTPAANIAMSSR
jgi:hypothetical protein